MTTAATPIAPTTILDELRALRGQSGMRRFIGGIKLPLKAMRFIAAHPKMWPWMIIPALINLVLFVITAVALAMNAPELLGWLWAQPEATWLKVVWYVVLAVVLLASVVLSYFAVLMVAGVIASPFNDQLSVITERELRGTVADARDGESMISGIMRSIVISLVTLLAYLACIIPLLFLHLIPGLGSLLNTVLGTAVSAIFLAFEYSDAALDRQGFSLKEKIARVRAHLDLAGGFGVGSALLMLIPLVNLLVMPVAVVGGTMLGIELREERDDAPAG
ncbi:EI24 domain-containing protein [Lujinxingia vulgaris]|nr:EI24 domain-containing protein [Lujinxingia vulgaris]